MSKKIGLVFLLLALFVFTGCGNQREFSGKIIETSMDGEAKLSSFIIRTDDNKEIGFYLTAETGLFGFTYSLSSSGFLQGDFSEIELSVKGGKAQGKMTGESGEAIPAYNAEYIFITKFLTEETARLPDGSVAELWRYPYACAYVTPDGTELLCVQDPMGPENVTVAGTESFDDLNPEAQSNVLKFYSRQGLLYDVQAELEKAYSEYLQTENKADLFNTYMLRQDISPSASNDRLMYFLTCVELPLSGAQVYERRLGAAFDRETGEAISNWELFSCSPDMAVKAIIELAGVTDEELRAELQKAFKPEYLVFFPDNLEVYFPRGTLPSQEYGYALALDYDEKLCAIMEQWAIPQSRG